MFKSPILKSYYNAYSVALRDNEGSALSKLIANIDASMVGNLDVVENLPALVKEVRDLLDSVDFAVKSSEKEHAIVGQMNLVLSSALKKFEEKQGEAQMLQNPLFGLF